MRTAAAGIALILAGGCTYVRDDLVVAHNGADRAIDMTIVSVEPSGRRHPGAVMGIAPGGTARYEYKASTRVPSAGLDVLFGVAGSEETTSVEVATGVPARLELGVDDGRVVVTTREDR